MEKGSASYSKGQKHLKPSQVLAKQVSTATKDKNKSVFFLYHRSIITQSMGSCQKHCHVQTLKLAFYLLAAALHKGGSVNPSPQDKTWPTPKARSDWFPVFFFLSVYSYLSCVPNAISQKCFDCKILIFFLISFNPCLSAQIDRCSKNSNDTPFNVFQVQICPAWSLLHFQRHSPLALSSNNLKWDFMQDLFSVKWEKSNPEAL